MKLRMIALVMAALALSASAATTWTGSVSSNLNDAANWDNGLPDSSGNFGTINAGAGILNGNPGGLFVIQNGGTFVTSGGNSGRRFMGAGSWTVGAGATFNMDANGDSDGVTQGRLFIQTGQAFNIEGGTVTNVEKFRFGNSGTGSTFLMTGGSFDMNKFEFLSDSVATIGGTDPGTITAGSISWSGTASLDWRTGTKIAMGSSGGWAESAWGSDRLLYNGKSSTDLSVSWADATNSAAGLGDGAYFVFSTNSILTLVSPEGFVGVPAGLAATPGFESVSLDWDDDCAGNFVSYSVYRSTNSGIYGAALATNVGSSAYTDNAVANGTTYYYVVTAIGTNGTESAQSSEVSALPADYIPPAAPTALAATAGDGSISLDWADNAESDFSSYSIFRSTTSGAYGSALATGLISSDYVDNDVTNNITYYYGVTATDTSTNESAQSAEVSATPAGPILVLRLAAGDLGNDTNNTYNLTEWGPSDWTLWGGSLTNPSQSKIDGYGISDLSYTPGSAGGTFRSFSTGKAPFYSWTDGSPAATNLNAEIKTALTSANTNSTGDRISFTVAASTNESTLYMVAGVLNGDLTLTASLPGTDDVIATYVNRGKNPNLALFKMDYTATSPGDQMTVTLEKTFNVVDKTGAIYIQSVALNTDTLVVMPNNYSEWLALYPALGSLTNQLDDFEPDGLNNLLEFALGGNPVISDASTVLPKGSTGSAEGTNWFYYTYNRLENAASVGLTYTVRSGSNLESGLTNTVPPSSVSSAGNGLETATHRISTDTATEGFMRLDIELTQ